MTNTTKKGIYFALITAFISGVSIFINKFAVGAIDSPLLFTTTKNSIVGILILLLLVRSKKLLEIKSLEKKDTFYLLLIGLIGGALPFYLFFTGISQVPAINAALIHKTLVIWVAILAMPFLKEKLTKVQAIAIALLFASNLLVGGFKGFQFSLGEFYILTATLLWAVENVIAKKVLTNVDAELVTAARMGFGSAILIIASFLTIPNVTSKIVGLTSIQMFWILATAITLFGYVSSWYKALKFAPAIAVSAVLVSSTLVTNILSAIFITHAWSLDLTKQGLVIAFGTVLYVASWIKSARHLDSPIQA